MSVMRLRSVCRRRSQSLLLRAVTCDSPRVGRQRLPVRRLLPLAKPDLLLLLLLLMLLLLLLLLKLLIRPTPRLPGLL